MAAALIQLDDIARQPIDVIEIVVRVKKGIAVLPEDAAMILIRSALSDKLELGAALRSRIDSTRQKC